MREYGDYIQDILDAVNEASVFVLGWCRGAPAGKKIHFDRFTSAIKSDIVKAIITMEGKHSSATKEAQGMARDFRTLLMMNCRKGRDVAVWPSVGRIFHFMEDTDMKRIRVTAIITVVIAVCVLVPGTGFAAAKNSINIGVGGMVGPDTTASAFFGEYERLLGTRIAIFGRGGSVSYKYDDDVYLEDGDPKGFDIGVRAYPMGSGGMKGFFVGGAIGYWSTEWTFTDDQGQSYEVRGKGDSSAIRADIEVGGRFNLGTETVSLMPAFHIGHFFSTSESCSYTAPASSVGTTCSKKSQVGLYGFFALSLGIAF